MVTMPRDWARRGVRASTACPSTRISPLSRRCTPERILMRVDLPAPFSPTMAWTLPGARSRSTSCSTSTPEKLLETPWTRRMLSAVPVIPSILEGYSPAARGGVGDGLHDDLDAVPVLEGGPVRRHGPVAGHALHEVVQGV